MTMLISAISANHTRQMQQDGNRKSVSVPCPQRPCSPPPGFSYFLMFLLNPKDLLRLRTAWSYPTDSPLRFNCLWITLIWGEVSVCFAQTCQIEMSFRRICLLLSFENISEPALSGPICTVLVCSFWYNILISYVYRLTERPLNNPTLFRNGLICCFRRKWGP